MLRAVSERGDWQGWIRFFLTALTNQAEAAEKTAKGILDLHAEYKEKISTIRSAYAARLLDALFLHTIFRTASIRKDANIHNTQTFFNLISKFLEAGIIKDITPKKRRNKVYAFGELIKLLNK